MRVVAPNPHESVQHKKKSDRYQLYSAKSCDELARSLSNFEFYIQYSKVSINPSGILYQVPAFDKSSGLIDDTNNTDTENPTKDAGEPDKTANEDGSECRVGIESIPDEANHVRLGISFLKHFYTALDYERNLIVIGLNKLGQSKNIVIKHDPKGKMNYPKEDPESAASIIWTIILLLLLAGCAVYCLHVARKREQEPGYVPALLKTEAA